jgi:hypothetical protein
MTRTGAVFGQKIRDVEIADDIEISRRALGRGRFSCSSLKWSACSWVPPGMNRAVNISRKLGLSAPHPIRIKAVIASRDHGAAARRRLMSSYPASRPNRLPQHTDKSVPGSQAEGSGLPGARNRRTLGLNRQQSGGCRFKRQVRSTTDVDLTSPFCTSTGR